MKKKLFFLVILIQLLFIAYLGIKIINKKKNILGAMNINPLKKSDFVFNKTDGLKYFYEPKPNNVLEEVVVGTDKKVIQSINSDSLNERFDYEIEKKPSTFRVLTLGDSFTYGMFIDTPKNYPEQLEEKLKKLNCVYPKKFEVINLGMEGYDIQYSVERYRVRGKKYNPDLLLWLLKDDDFTQIEELIHPDVERYLKEGYLGFDEKTLQWPAYNKAMEKINNSYSEEEILALQKKFLVSIRNYYQNPIIFIVLTKDPKFITIVENFIKTDRKSSIFITNLMDGNNLTFIDKHPNEKGYEILADEIYKFITKKDIIPCK